MKQLFGTKEYDSFEEYVFELWLQDLQEAGYVASYEYQPESFQLSDSLFVNLEVLDTKRKVPTLINKECCILKGTVYTADYKIFFTDKAIPLFTQNMDALKRQKPLLISQNNICYVDVKGTYNANESLTKFEKDRKWTWSKYNIFINKCIPEDVGGLFDKTFTPIDYPLLTEKTRKPKKIKHTVRRLSDFINNSNTIQGTEG